MQNPIAKFLAKRVARKKIEKDAVNEADTIADRKLKSPGYVSSTPVPAIGTYSVDPGRLTGQQKQAIQARRDIRNQVIKTRLNQFDSKK